METIIRKVEEKDNLSLAKMIREVFEEHNAPQEGTVYSDPTTDNLFELFKVKRSVLWVAESNNEAIGCCGIFPSPGLDENCAELVKFYLAKKARGKGIGAELMQRSIDSAKGLKYSRLYLESLPHFAKAVSIYEKQGFVKLSHPLGKSIHATCNIWMLKELK
jgi:putative acetyltransferase